MTWKAYEEWEYYEHVLEPKDIKEHLTEQDLINMNNYINQQDEQIIKLIGPEDWDTEYWNYIIDSGYQAEMDPDTYYSNYSYHDDIYYDCG